MYNILEKIAIIFSLYMSHIIVHEFGHYLVLKLYGKKAILSIGTGKQLAKKGEFELRCNIMASYVECEENIGNERLFYISGILANVVLFLINFICFNQFDFVWIYSAICVIGGICFICPMSDLYRALKLDRYFNVDDNAKSNWNIICFVLSGISLIGYVVWFCVRY